MAPRSSLGVVAETNWRIGLFESDPVGGAAALLCGAAKNCQIKRSIWRPEKGTKRKDARGKNELEIEQPVAVFLPVLLLRFAPAKRAARQIGAARTLGGAQMSSAGRRHEPVEWQTRWSLSDGQFALSSAANCFVGSRLAGVRVRVRAPLARALSSSPARQRPPIGIGRVVLHPVDAARPPDWRRRWLVRPAPPPHSRGAAARGRTC